MKTTLDIPSQTLAEVVRRTKVGTKREAVVTALEEWLRQKQLQELTESFGTSDTFMTAEDLERLRSLG